MGVGLVGFGFFGDRVRGIKAGEQTSSSPAFACTGKEDGEQCHQNGTVCCLFLISVNSAWNCGVCPKCVVSFKRK